MLDVAKHFISIHAAREGGDKMFCAAVATDSAFQSTPPVKAATKQQDNPPTVLSISIHAAREGGDFVIVAVTRDYRISIHAAREGGDMMSLHVAKTNDISIHAAREGGDAALLSRRQIRKDFNPRRP